jgi:hypothetical protein
VVRSADLACSSTNVTANATRVSQGAAVVQNENGLGAPFKT